MQKDLFQLFKEKKYFEFTKELLDPFEEKFCLNCGVILNENEGRLCLKCNYEKQQKKPTFIDLYFGRKS